MKRVKANDPKAMVMMGTVRYDEGDYQGAFNYWTKAAELGDDADAHYFLSCLYCEGKGVEKDTKKRVYHSEHAAIGGHLMARFNLGIEEWKIGRIERAIKHWIIAAKLGDDQSVEELKDCFRDGSMSKDVFAEALRAHQAAMDATKSPQREVAEAAMQKMRAARAARQN
jgi:TPR repeat protein